MGLVFAVMTNRIGGLILLVEGSAIRLYLLAIILVYRVGKSNNKSKGQ